jgi:hypothetical protein
MEWEFLQKPFIITQIVYNPNLPQNIKEIEVERNDEYQIEAKIRTNSLDLFDSSEKINREALFENTIKLINIESVPGSFVQTFDINGSTSNKISNVELKGCRAKFSFCPDDHLIGGTIHADKIVVKRRIKKEIEWVIDWYLNGPKNTEIYSRNTIRKISNIDMSLERYRVLSDNIPIDFHLNEYIKELENKILKERRIWVDFAYISTEYVKFIIAEVPKEFGPSWSENICIEYRKNLGPIPNSEQRRAISEIVSFVLGKRLLHVGYTKYGNDGEFLEKLAISPWGNYYSRYACPKSDFQPFNFGIEEFTKNHKKFEDILCELVPNYLMLRNELGLDKVLSKYWASKDMPIGTNLPTLSSGLETLMDSWFRINKSKSMGSCIPSEEFKKLGYCIAEDIKSIEDKINKFKIGNEKPIDLKENSMKYIDVLQNKLKNFFNNLNQMPISKKYEIFFEEIGLKIGQIEKKAIKERNKMAHVRDVHNREEYREIVQLTYAYQTLFHRAFLKILDYKGNYMDLYTEGLPERHIDVPVGEN